jgi:hypothetical protein
MAGYNAKPAISAFFNALMADYIIKIKKDDTTKFDNWKNR